MAPKSYLGYFVTRKELATIFLDAGGDLDDTHIDSMELTTLAHRSIFRYLLPGRIRVYFDVAIIDGDEITGITFKIGKNNAKLSDVPVGLLERCHDMFDRDPDEFVQVGVPKYLYEWRRGDKILGQVQNLDFMESDTRMEELY
ncbi:hypothetical protein RhiJN_05232 [Ceratobasidium sp. AG-Ba]|nr:hypothetical protein RhiJN_05232 [Ceratobasidium sp. AG-Ba]QRW06147.1 hypothetical protein RhiLY_05146 [Ceratobasidium sp. AG-Ba]